MKVKQTLVVDLLPCQVASYEQCRSLTVPPCTKGQAPAPTTPLHETGAAVTRSEMPPKPFCITPIPHRQPDLLPFTFFFASLFYILGLLWNCFSTLAHSFIQLCLAALWTLSFTSNISNLCSSRSLRELLLGFCLPQSFTSTLFRN